MEAVVRKMTLKVMAIEPTKFKMSPGLSRNIANPLSLYALNCSDAHMIASVLN